MIPSPSPWHHQYRQQGYSPCSDLGSQLDSAKGSPGEGGLGKNGDDLGPLPLGWACLQKMWCLTLPQRTPTSCYTRAARGAT